MTPFFIVSDRHPEAELDDTQSMRDWLVSGFQSITEKIETGSAAGKLVFHVFAALAEFERNLIRERTKAGLDAARARGRKGGRKPALTEKAVREIRQLLKDPDIEVTEVAKRYGVSRATIYKYLRAT
jgi:DNA invertase Pin-like site-specific DNA recombinase